MKKIFGFLLAGMLAASSANAMTFAMGFGKYDSEKKECTGGWKGFCFHCDTREASVLSFGLSPSGSVLEVSFSITEARHRQPEKVKAFEGANSFDFDADFELPAELNQGLRAAHPIVIRAGSYPMRIEGDRYTISIPLDGRQAEIITDGNPQPSDDSAAKVAGNPQPASGRIWNDRSEIWDSRSEIAAPAPAPQPVQPTRIWDSRSEVWILLKPSK